MAGISITPDRRLIRAAYRDSVLTLHNSGEIRQHTGDALATTIETVTVPGGLLGPNGALFVAMQLRASAAQTNNTSSRVYIGGTASADECCNLLSKVQEQSIGRYITNSDNVAVQRGRRKYGSAIFTNSSAIGATYSVNTENDFDVTFAVKLDAADTGVTLTVFHTMVLAMVDNSEV